MGFIRGSLFVIVSVLLLVSMMLSGIFLNFSLSLQYGNLKEEVVPFVENLTSDMGLDRQFGNQIIDVAQIYCTNEDSLSFSTKDFDLPISQNYEVDISCESIEKGVDAVVSEASERIFEKMYYQDYDCTITECFEESKSPMFLISEDTKDYLQRKYKETMLFSSLLLVPAFFLMQRKRDFPLTIGVLVIVASLPLLGLNKLFLIIPDNMMKEIISIFFNQTNFVFVRMIIIGVSLVGVGLLFKLFGAGFKIKEFISKIKSKEKKLGKSKESEEKDEKNKLKKQDKEKSNKEISQRIRRNLNLKKDNKDNESED